MLCMNEQRKLRLIESTGYGDRVASKAIWRDCIYHEMVAKFIFRYTSIDMLRAMEIVERQSMPPEASPVSGTDVSSSSNKGKRKADSVKPEELSDDDLSPEELLERQREAELEAQLEDLRKGREIRLKDKRTRKKVKMEIKPTFVSGEIIELT
ncbi:hypothetical protein CPB83DRAFT_902680 [Crepidotus variabilis]|uniref:Uncharacterized protein n=1 Tax=Crepidotus variabilis TaxID=179855 RepID=A0A9P6JV00_9AGAR|nr:hypothetical protein CPB83DRAFT_902680 [Crepidotus variabilis]